MFSRFLDTLGAKKYSVNTEVFGALETQNHGIYCVFFWLLIAKITVFTMLFGPGLAKTLVLTQFSAEHCKQK